jgi:hypothetical protein
MFVKAIEVVSKFTRPIHFIYRYYFSKEIHPAASTLFLVNSDGFAVTCKHVASELIAASGISTKCRDFKIELSASEGGKKKKRVLKELEKKIWIH